MGNRQAPAGPERVMGNMAGCQSTNVLLRLLWANHDVQCGSGVEHWYAEHVHAAGCRGRRDVLCVCGQVDPWVLDVTDAAFSGAATDVQRAARQRNTSDGPGQADADTGRVAEISYRGLFQGQDPPVATGNAYIMMESSLVLMR